MLTRTIDWLSPDCRFYLCAHLERLVEDTAAWLPGLPSPARQFCARHTGQ